MVVDEFWDKIPEWPTDRPRKPDSPSLNRNHRELPINFSYHIRIVGFHDFPGLVISHVGNDVILRLG